MSAAAAATLLGGVGITHLTRQAGVQIPLAQALADAKVVLFYFSASWCPDCRPVTPKLKTFYGLEGIRQAGVEVVYVSSDFEEGKAESYYQQKHGDWLTMPWAASQVLCAHRGSCMYLPCANMCVCASVHAIFWSVNNRRNARPSSSNSAFSARSPSLLLSIKICLASTQTTQPLSLGSQSGVL